MPEDARWAVRPFSWECWARSLRCWTSASHSSNSCGPNRSRGSSSRSTRYTWGRVIWGIFFPPILLQAKQEGPGQHAHRDMVMPTRPGAGLVFIQSHVALLSFELGFNAPSGAAHIGQGRQGVSSGALDR